MEKCVCFPLGEDLKGDTAPFAELLFFAFGCNRLIFLLSKKHFF